VGCPVAMAIENALLYSGRSEVGKK
jgi:hypothetical protein